MNYYYLCGLCWKMTEAHRWAASFEAGDPITVKCPVCLHVHKDAKKLWDGNPLELARIRRAQSAA